MIVDENNLEGSVNVFFNIVEGKMKKRNFVIESGGRLLWHLAVPLLIARSAQAIPAGGGE